MQVMDSQTSTNFVNYEQVVNNAADSVYLHPTNADYEQCQGGYTLLSNQQQYDTPKLAVLPTTSDQYMTSHNNITDSGEADDEQKKFGIDATTYDQNRVVPLSTDDPYLIVLPSDDTLLTAADNTYLAVLPSDDTSLTAADNTYLAVLPSDDTSLTAADNAYMAVLPSDDTSPPAAADEQYIMSVLSSNEYDEIADVQTAVENTGEDQASNNIILNHEATKPTSTSQASLLGGSNTNQVYDFPVLNQSASRVTRNLMVLPALIFAILAAVYLVSGKLLGQEHDASAFSDSASRSQHKHVSAQFKRNFEIYTDANLSAFTLLSCINDLLVVGGKEESWSLFEYQFYNLTTESFEFKVQESDDFMADAVLIRSNSLACIEPSTRRASGHVVIESAHSTNFSVSEHSFNTLKHISYAAQDDTIYVTDYYNGTYMSRNGAFNWTHVFSPSSLGKLWYSVATVRASVTAAATYDIVFWTIEHDKPTETYHFAIYQLRKASQSAYAVVARNQVALPTSMSNTSPTLKIVDDGKGNAFIFEQNGNVFINLHWYWMDASYNGQYGGVLLNMSEIGMFYSVAVDIDKELLYVGRKQNVSVFKLIYE